MGTRETTPSTIAVESARSVAREVVKAEELVDYTRRDNVAERLAKKFGAAMGEGAMRALKSIPALR